LRSILSTITAAAIAIGAYTLAIRLEPTPASDCQTRTGAGSLRTPDQLPTICLYRQNQLFPAHIRLRPGGSRARRAARPSLVLRQRVCRIHFRSQRRQHRRPARSSQRSGPQYNRSKARPRRQERRSYRNRYLDPRVAALPSEATLGCPGLPDKNVFNSVNGASLARIR